MTNVFTNKPLRVATDGSAGPYVTVSVEQLDELRRLFDNNKVSYWVEENVISFDGSPEIAVVNLGRDGDTISVQALLDQKS